MVAYNRTYDEYLTYETGHNIAKYTLNVNKNSLK